MEHWLLFTIFLPLAGAVLVWLLGAAGRADVRQSALVTSLVTLALAVYLIVEYQQPSEGAAFAASDFLWLGGSDAAVNIHFSLGLDGLGLWLFGLSALL